MNVVSTRPQGPIGPPGKSIINALIDGSYNLILQYSDGSQINVGLVRGPVGATGRSIQNSAVDGANHLILYYSDGLTIDAGLLAVGANGDKGWSPVLAAAADGARRVFQVTDWVGGLGTKPATGSYVGPTGLTTVLANAVDVRGAAGAGSGNVNSTGTIIANRMPVYANTTGDLLKDGGSAASPGFLLCASVLF